MRNEERFSPHPPREGDARVLGTQAKSWYLLWHHLQAMRMPCEKPCSGHLISPTRYQLRWQTSDCLCSGGSSNKRAGKRAGLGGGVAALPPAEPSCCDVMALQPGGAERGLPQFLSSVCFW